MAVANAGGPGDGQTRRRRAGLAALAVVLVAGLVAIIVVFAGGKDQNKVEKSGTATTPLSVMSDTTVPFSQLTDTATTTTGAPADSKATESPLTTTQQATGAIPTTGTAASPGLTFATNKAKDFAYQVADQADKAGTTGNPKTSGTPPDLLVDVQMGLAVAGGGLEGLPEDSCLAADFDELKEAVENKSCGMVYLVPGTIYEIEEEIYVRRRVVVMGNPSVLPVLDGEDAVRTFHVMAGGFLDLRFVQQLMSDGIFRDPLPFERFGNTAPTGKVNEIRGGSVMIEAGALGAKFTGVIFIDDPDLEEGIARNIRRTLNREVYRIYGGHVFVAGGQVDFIGCLFFDLTILYAFGNTLFIGANVLQLGGILTFTGCTFLENTVLGVENGVGLFVAQFAGLSTYTFNTFAENNFAVNENCLAQAFLVAGGVMVMTLSNINEYSGAIVYSGTGELNVLGGVEVLTGVNNVEAFALGSTFGVGFEYTIGAGVAIHTGSPFNEYNGIYFFAALGEITFLGAGVFISTGSPTAEYVAQASENGQGGSTFIGAGYGSWTGTATIEFISIAAVFMLGEYIANDAGFVVWVGSPVVEGSVLEFCRLLGSVIYVGAGALVLYGTPLIEFYGPYVTRTPEFYVMGTCEYEGAPLGVVGPPEETRSRALTTDRMLYNLPTFVAPMQGCQKLVDFFLGSEKGSDGSGGGGEEGRARALSDKRRGPAAVAASKPRSSLGPQAPRTLVASERTGPRLSRPNLPKRKLSAKQRELRAFFAQGGHTRHLPPQVRRHATNLWERSHLALEEVGSEEDRKLAASTWNPMDVSVLAVNVTRVTQLDRKKLEGRVPAKWLDTIEAMQAQINSMHKDGVAPTDDDMPAFNIDGKTEGYCGLCNVPGAAGAGLSGCQVEDDCSNLILPNNQKLANGTDVPGDGDELKYDDHHIMMATISTTSEADVEALDLPELQEAVVAAVAELQGASQDKDSIIVNLYNGELDPQFGEHQEARARSLYENQDFSKTHIVEMVLLTTTKEAMDIVRAALDGSGDEAQEGRLAQNIKAAYATMSGIELGHVGIISTNELFMPAYNSPLHLTARHRSLGSHSAVLVDPEQTAVPVTHAKYGKTYHMYLENFAPSTTLQLDLYRFKEHETAEHVVHQLQSVMTDEKGHAMVDMIFQEEMIPADYFFQAKAENGQVGYSQSYELRHSGQERKLYGTHMYV